MFSLVDRNFEFSFGVVARSSNRVNTMLGLMVFVFMLSGWKEVYPFEDPKNMMPLLFLYAAFFLKSLAASPSSTVKIRNVGFCGVETPLINSAIPLFVLIHKF